MLKAAIFDMDGLLVDSEPFWRAASIDLFGALGVPLTAERCYEVAGLRLDEVVLHWYRRHPWPDPDHPRLVEAIVGRVAELVGLEGRLKPGVVAALDVVRAAGLRTALASSSPLRLIRAVLDRFELEDRFEVVHSAELESWGKPHPAIYLGAASRLGVAPEECLAFEDSLPGVIAAKAARMRCIAVPERLAAKDPRYALADVQLDALTEVDAALIERLRGPS